MHARILCIALSVCTFTLLLVGGVVHTTGSSLACPDWPLCYGQVFPPMQGGILYEHSHRLLASFVGFLTVALAVTVWRGPSRHLRQWAAAGVGLVILQGLLGGLTVIYRLPTLVSITHLGTSMAFFAWTIAMFFWVRKASLAPQSSVLSRPDAFQTAPMRRRVAWAMGLVYVQIVLGAVVRHTHSSLACGLEVVTCAGGAWPTTGMQWVQTAHRVMACVVLAGVIYGTIAPMKWARLNLRPQARRLGIIAHVVLLAQMVMGALTLKTGVNLHVVTTHLALGAGLWGTLVAFYLALGPLGCARAHATDDAPGPQQAHGLYGAG